MRNEIKKTLSLGALCSMAFFAANSAFAGTGVDQEKGGDYGVITSDDSDDSYYTYENWTSSNPEYFSNPNNATWKNITVGAGTTYAYVPTSSSQSLTIEDSLYLYGEEGNLATFTHNTARSVSVGGDISMIYSSFEMSTGSLSVGGTMTLNEGAEFEKTSGSLVFKTGSSIVINGGEFTSDATTLYGSSTISLALDSVDLSGATATATILGSIDLGTVSFGNDSSAYWTIALDVSSVLDGYTDDFTVDLKDLIIMSSTEMTKISIVLVDSDGNTYDDYTASLTGDNLSSATVSFTYLGAAVPEPSTYAMIFGVVALGFAAYRRRK